MEQVYNTLVLNKRRKRGRSHKRWADDIKAVAGGTWTRTAKDRDAWNMLEEAFANQQADNI